MNDTTWHWFKDLESRAMWFADARGIPKPIASEAYDRLADALVERIGKGIIAAPLSKAAWTAQFLGLCKEADRKRQRATQWYSHCEIIAGRSVEPEEVGYPISEEVSDPYESARKLLLTAARRFAASETQLRRLEAFFETRRVACRESAAAEGVSPEANRESVEKARSRAVAGTLLLLAEDYCREHAQLLFREGFQIERPLSASVVKAFDHLTHTPSRYNLDLSGLKPGFEALWADAERYLFCGLSSRNDADLRALPMSFLVMLTITRSWYALHSRLPHILWLAGPPAA